MTAKVMLTDKQRATLLDLLARFAPPVERVDAYGSRVTGKARPGSDIDLVLAGAVDHRLLGRVHAVVDDSYLSISADLKAYDLLDEGGFRDQVIATAVTLFDRDDLRAARQDRADST